MEQSLKGPIFLNLWREKVKALAGNVFSPPYLSAKFILFFLLTNITHFAIIVMNYSPSYWHSSLRETGIAPRDMRHEISPTGWLIFSIVYLSIALFCLTVFNYRWSMIGWLAAEAIHFWGLGNWLNHCSFSRWSISAGVFCESFDAKIYWIIVAILMGFLFSANLYPNGYPLPQKKLKKGISLAAIFFSTAWSVLLLVGIVASKQKPTMGWVPLELDRNPPPLGHAAHAYDTKRNKLLIFGGVNYVNGQWIYKNETWEWDGKKWLNVSPSLKDSPDGRTSAGMAYDENRDVIVLYGGYNPSGALCETWEWDGEKWSSKCPPQCPGARFVHEMYYDPIRKKVVLYGGYDNKTYFKDAWEWDGDTWTKVELENNSPVASHFALAYNPDKDFAFGLLSGSPGGTWTFKDNRWTHLSPGMEPSNRNGMRLVYEPQRKIFVTFGGYSNNLSLNDTWFFNGKNWDQFTNTKLQPSARSDTVVWYDEVRKHIMLFGGYYSGRNNSTVFNDTWELVLPDQ